MMSWETAYSALNLLVIPAWALLIFLPGHAITRRLVHSALYPLTLGLIYLVSLGAALLFGVADPEAGMSNLAGVMSLFDHPNGILTGWTHFLVFDLFVGAWIARDARRCGLAHLLTVPALLLSFLFGPLGLLLYLLIRKLSGKGGWGLFEDGK